MCLKTMFKSLFTALFFISILAGVSFAGEKEIILLHTNDIHGNVFPIFDKRYGEKGANLGGFAQISTKIKEIRKEYPGKVLLIDAGDISQGTIVSNSFYGAPVTDFMNYMKYDASTFGNHEFDWGPEMMAEQSKKRKFPMVCANLVEKSTGKPSSYFKPYTIINRNGLKIGLIGLATPETVRMSFRKNVEKFDFLDPVTSVEKYQKELQAKGIKIIGVISHLGYNEDLNMAKKLSNIAFIVGGHSHSTIEKPYAENGIPVVQAGSSGKYLGFVKLAFDDKTGKLLNWEGKLIPIESEKIAKDLELEKRLNFYNDKVKGKMAEVIGELSEDITHSQVGKFADTTVGKVVTDILIKVTGADVAIYNTHGLRAGMQKGPITRESVFQVLPFDNSIITYNIKGSDMKELLNYYVDRSSYSQLAGVTLNYDSERPDGDRLTDIKIDGKPIDVNKTYKIVSVDFLYSVSQDFKVLKDATNVEYGLNIRDEVEQYIEKVKNITVPEATRINVLKEAPSSKKRQ